MLASTKINILRLVITILLSSSIFTLAWFQNKLAVCEKTLILLVILTVFISIYFVLLKPLKRQQSREILADLEMAITPTNTTL